MAIKSNSALNFFNDDDTDAVVETFEHSGKNNSTREQRETAKFYANIGFEVPFTDEDGNEQITFISLPISSGNLSGIALDYLKPQTLPSKKGNMRNMVAAKNAFLENLLNRAAKLPAGEAVILPSDIRVELRHAGEKATNLGEDEENPIQVPEF